MKEIRTEQIGLAAVFASSFWFSPSSARKLLSEFDEERIEDWQHLKGSGGY